MKAKHFLDTSVLRALLLIFQIYLSFEKEKDKLLGELTDALKNIKILKGFLPICSTCEKTRDDQGYWNQIESYIREHSEADFSHGICPDCAKNFILNIMIRCMGNRKNRKYL